MELSEEIKEARDILQNIIKAKKTFRMYPENNPIYIKPLKSPIQNSGITSIIKTVFP